LLAAFFTERLMRQRHASPHTIATYRDTFRLLFQFVEHRHRKTPSTLSITDLDAPLLGAFLEHLERERGNSARTRNIRLAALRAFFRYAAVEEPEHVAVIQRVLALPTKRYRQAPVAFLTRPEVEALLAAPDLQRRSGRRDRTLLLLAVQTGLRVSELSKLRCQDIVLKTGAHVRCHGKGRKERCTPLRSDAVLALHSWLRERNGQPTDVLFPNARGSSLTRDGIAYLLQKYVAIARSRCPSLKRKRVSPHVLRHTTAMELLHHGVDRAVIALWLGHESAETTDMYLHADLSLKEKALSKTAPVSGHAHRFRPDDQLLAFLNSL
jgi:site-specific recombinase XerD